MIVVFGGAFNPPTVAHEAIARLIIEQLPCKALLFLPVGDHYQKPGLAPAKDRIQMLWLICQELEGAFVSDLEAKHTRVLTTYESLQQVKKHYPEEDIAFVMGADNLKDIFSWSQYERLLGEFYHIVLTRDGLDVAAYIDTYLPSFKERFILLKAEPLAVSSTMYRDHLEQEHLVPPAVGAYIKSRHLYGR